MSLKDGNHSENRSFSEYLRVWIQKDGEKPDDLDRILAFTLSIAITCYLMVFLGRIVVAMAWPLLIVLLVLLLIRLFSWDVCDVTSCLLEEILDNITKSIEQNDATG